MKNLNTFITESVKRVNTFKELFKKHDDKFIVYTKKELPENLKGTLNYKNNDIIYLFPKTKEINKKLANYCSYSGDLSKKCYIGNTNELELNHIEFSTDGLWAEIIHIDNDEHRLFWDGLSDENGDFIEEIVDKDTDCEEVVELIINSILNN